VADWPTVLLTPVGWNEIVGVAAGEFVVPVDFSDSAEFLSEGVVIAVTLT
jgi:hypothetical protein